MKSENKNVEKVIEVEERKLYNHINQYTVNIGIQFLY